MKIYKINEYPDYELHYSNEVQLVYSLKRKKYLKLVKTQNGYLQVGLCKNGEEKKFKIHRLVWQSLKGEIPTDLEINHIDEVKTNNSIENLELVTRKENNNYGTRTARAAKARINHPMRSKTVVGIKKDLSEILQYPSIMEASRDRGFDQGAISSCCLNKKNYKSHKDFIWFFKEDFEQYLKKFNNNLQDVINYKLSLFK